MTKKEYIRQMDDEELIDALDDYDETLITPSCKSKYCPHYRDDGRCEMIKKGGCRDAYRAWLNSEVTNDGEWYE